MSVWLLDCLSPEQLLLRFLLLWLLVTRACTHVGVLCRTISLLTTASDAERTLEGAHATHSTGMFACPIQQSVLPKRVNALERGIA